MTLQTSHSHLPLRSLRRLQNPYRCEMTPSYKSREQRGVRPALGYTLLGHRESGLSSTALSLRQTISFLSEEDNSKQSLLSLILSFSLFFFLSFSLYERFKVWEAENNPGFQASGKNSGPNFLGRALTVRLSPFKSRGCGDLWGNLKTVVEIRQS